MSLLFFDGFQDCNVMPKPEWEVGTAFGAGTGRDGTANSSLSTGQGRKLVLTPAATTCYCGFAWWPAAIGAMTNTFASNFLVSFWRSGTQECLLMVNGSSGMLELRRTNRTGTLLATSTGHTPISPGQWHHIQAKVVLRSDGAGSAEVRLNGVTVINYSGQTAGTTGDVTHLELGYPSSSVTQHDDFWVCDGVDATASQGAPNNSFLGDLKVSSLFPTGAGDSTGFTPSTGSNWSCVDEVPANTTDYVSTAVAATRDLYQLGDVPAGALAPVAVRVGLYAQKSDAGASSIKPVIKENGTVTVGSTYPLLTTWAGFWGSLRTKKPSGDSPWTIADVNGLQAGVELA